MIYCMKTRIFFSVNNTDFLSCHELSNYRISITRNIADSHGFSFLSRIFFFLVPNYRIIEFYLFCPETCPWTHWSQGGNCRIFVFRDSPWFPVWFKNNSLIRKFVTKIIPWYSVWLKENSQIRKFVTKIIPWYSAILRVIKDNSIIL